MSIIQKLNGSYPNLFNKRDEEDVEEGEGLEGEISLKEDVSSNEEYGGFASKWNWISWVDRISEVTRLNWYQVYDMQINEFLNIMCYIIDKTAEEKRQIEEWKRKH